MSPRVLMFGPSLDVKGGITSVERLIIAHVGGVEHVATMTEGGAWERGVTYARAIARLLAPGHPGELVHIHFSSKGSTLRKAVLCALARLAHKPVVLHAHGSGFREFHEALPRVLKRVLASTVRGCTRFIALSASWEAYYQEAFGLEAGQLAVLRNPVALPEVVPRRGGRERLKLVFLGRIGDRKGAFELIHAVAALPTALRERTQLVLAGDGEAERARALASTLGVDALVHDWLSPEQRDTLLAEADLFALPSRNEGLPMAMLEAMGWGLPIVVTPVGGIPELVMHGDNGWLVPPGDVAALAQALETLLGDEALRLALGARARQAVEGLGMPHYARALAALYDAAGRQARPLARGIVG